MAIVKYVASDISVAIILMFRYIFCLPTLIFIGLRLDGLSHFKIKNKKILLLRSVSGLLGLSFWYLSVIYLEISKALALGQIMPIFICLSIEAPSEIHIADLVRGALIQWLVS